MEYYLYFDAKIIGEICINIAKMNCFVFLRNLANFILLVRKNTEYSSI